MDYDVIVIGAGQAGPSLSARMAEAGRTVLLAEARHIGGTCVNYGCTPTKTMMASARAAHAARTAGRLGVRTGDVEVDLSAVVDRKNEIVDQWRSGSEKRLERAGEKLTVARDHARFVGEREIEVGGARHRGEVVIINTGARARTPPIPGLDDVDWLDNESILDVRDTPDHLVAIGGGYVACEFAQMFGRFGSEVTIIQRGEHLIDREDPDISEALEEAFRAEGIELELGREAEEVARSPAGVRVKLDSGAEVEGSHLLVAVGRVPNTDDLGCGAAGVELDDRGFIVVDDEYRTTAEGVYAVGDVTGGPQFTHTSWDDHRILYDLLMGQTHRRRSGRVIPHCVFTDPQVAGVGLTERQGEAEGVDYEVATMPFGRVARAVEIDEPAGTMKVLIDPATERVLGAAIVGAEAGELIHIFAVLMQARASARAIVDAQAAHPTFAEGVQSLDRYALT